MGEDAAPALARRQLLRIFYQATQELGDGAKRLGGGNRAGVRAGDSDRRLSGMAQSFGDGCQRQSTITRSGSKGCDAGCYRFRKSAILHVHK